MPGKHFQLIQSEERRPAHLPHKVTNSSDYVQQPNAIQRAISDPTVENLTPEVIRSLHQSHGNTFVSRLISQSRSTKNTQRKPNSDSKGQANHHSTDARPKSPETLSDPGAVQRSIGLELEVPDVYSWQPTLLWGQQAAMNKAGRRKRFSKGAPIIQGTGFQLQGEDDSVNSQRSNIEFVTDAFSEDQGGMDALNTAMDEILAIGAAMNQNAVANQFLDISLLPGDKRAPTAFLQGADHPINLWLEIE